MVFSLCDVGPNGRMHPGTEQAPNSRHRRRELATKALRTSRSASTAATHHGNRPERSSRRSGAPSRRLSAGALAVPAPWPAAGPTLAFLQLLLGPADAAFSGHFLLGIVDPADELVAGQRRDVLPGIECRGVGGQRLAQVSWKACAPPHRH